MIGFATSKPPRNPKFTLNLKDQVLSYESLVYSHSSKSQGPRPPVRCKLSARPEESTELTNVAFSSVVVYGNFYNIAISHAQ